MNHKALLLMSLLMAHTSGVVETAALDEKKDSPLGERVLLLQDKIHDSHFGSLSSFIALKESIEKRGYSVNVFSTKEIHQLRGAPLDLAGFKDSSLFDHFCVENEDLIEAIKESDYIVINGCGSIHGASAYALKLLYLAYISKTFFGKHVQIINHSVYPQDNLDLDELIICKLYKEVYEKMDFIAIRDRLSNSLMKILGVENRLTFDMLPTYIRDHYSNPKMAKNRIVIADSLALTSHGLDALTQYMQAMKEKGFEVVVLTEHLNCQTNFGSSSEYIHPKSIEEWLDIVNNAALIVSGRFHLSIAAMCLKTPMIILSSDTPKNKALTTLSPSLNCLECEDPNLYANLMGKTHYLMTCSFEDLELPDLQTLTNYAGYNLLMLKNLDKTPHQGLIIPVKS